MQSNSPWPVSEHAWTFESVAFLAIFPTVFSFRLTSFSGGEGLLILRVQLLETLDSITLF